MILGLTGIREKRTATFLSFWQQESLKCIATFLNILIFLFVTNNLFFNITGAISYWSVKKKSISGKQRLTCGFVLWLPPDIFPLLCFSSVSHGALWTQWMVLSALNLFSFFASPINLPDLKKKATLWQSMQQKDKPFKNVQLAFIMRPHIFFFFFK